MKHFLHALKGLFLFSAVIHVMILCIISLERGDLWELNYFNLLDLDHFVPTLLTFEHSTLASALVAGVIFLIIYAITEKRS